ncbi:benzoate 4-monooxygenase cytochrome p450 [Moniliophthora roreri]|nr:benzoate 4-monooxygenase cytochrome p450 [Moniliophthora roreri]
MSDYWVPFVLSMDMGPSQAYVLAALAFATLLVTKLLRQDPLNPFPGPRDGSDSPYYTATIPIIETQI